MKKLSFIAMMFFILQSCSPRMRANLDTTNLKPLDVKTPVWVLQPKEALPDSSFFIGDVNVGGEGGDCGYTTIIEDLKAMARESGANVVHLMSVKTPSLLANCFRVKANLYRNFKPEALSKMEDRFQWKSQLNLPEGDNYALVHFYRPGGYKGGLVGYKIREGKNGVIGRVRDNEKFTYKVTSFKEYKFSAKTEIETSVIINIEKGKEYFVRCGIKSGIIVGRPELYLMENEMGKLENVGLNEKK